MIKLGDNIVRGNVDSKGFVVNYPKHKVRDYRVVSTLNQKIKLQETLIIDGFEELGEIEEFDKNLLKKLRLMFPDKHLVHQLFGGTWDHIHVGDF